jgi:hypothetical protein
MQSKQECKTKKQNNRDGWMDGWMSPCDGDQYELLLFIDHDDDDDTLAPSSVLMPSTISSSLLITPGQSRP